MGDTKDVQLDGTTTGIHNTGHIRDVVTEWNPKEPAAQEFKDMVVRELSALKNKAPDFDSGYIEVEVGNKYMVNHEKLGGIPNKVVVYHSSVAEPTEKDTVRIIPSITSIDSGNPSLMATSGVQVNHFGDGKKTQLTAADDTLLQHAPAHTKGYIRLLLWR